MDQNIEIIEEIKSENARSEAKPERVKLRTNADIISFNPEPYEEHDDRFTDNGQTQRKLGRSISQVVLDDGSNPQRVNQDAPRQRAISAIVRPNIPNGVSNMRRNRSTNSLTSQQMNLRPRITQAKNGSMVLQLVVPPSENGNCDTGSMSPVFSNGLYGTNLKKRIRHNSTGTTPQDLYPPYGNGVCNPAYEEFEYPNNFGGAGTVVSEAISHITVTSPEEKKRKFREYLTTILCCMYALLLITLGVTIFIADTIYEISPIPQIFGYYIVCISFLFIVYILIDVRVFLNKKIAYNKLLEKNCADDVEYEDHPDGGLHMSIPLPAAAKLQKPLPHFYCFATGRHAGSMYLKIGAAAFCIGHLVHCGLLIGYQIVFLTTDEEAFYKCTTIELLVLDIIYPVYSFLLLFFIFKYSNVIISRNVSLARFGFMHCIAASLCFWVLTIVRETLNLLAFYGDYDKYENDTYEEVPKARFMEVNKLRLFTGLCEGDSGMAIIYQNFSPYLFPFSVEFNILVVGILFIVWGSIASCKQNYDHNESTASIGKECDSDIEGPVKESNLTIHADCHSSNKGLFSGVLVFIVIVISIILFFVAASDERFQETGLIINTSTELIILIIMGIASVYAYWRLAYLDINKHHISILDDILLFICMPAFFLNAIFSIVASVYFSNALNIIFLLIQVIQVVIQTTFIIDGLRRCSNCRDLREEKPGREVVTFLIITNVALWISQTFEVKSHGLHDDRYEFYGQVLWTILGHVCLPLMMFYRFHASACLVDIWKYGYEKASH